MKICVLGKYPPIEGGVSTHTYWLVRGLAQRGHEVHVVTNADEVEDTFRMTFEAGDAEWYQPQFEGSGGRVSVYNPEPFAERSMGYIPAANPFVSKLASLATDVVRRHGCEAILAYYYEPYAVAGWLASRWTDRPLIVKHAGSDLDRLFRVPDLATTYKEILRSADAVLTQPALMSRFMGLGVERQRLEADVPYSLSREVFNPQARPMELAKDVPVIGVYGKIGVSKGTFDLIASLGALARRGLAFRFAAMIGAAQGRLVARALEQAGIADRTDIIPLLPNWRVPAFLRACTAVCFLERDFPVAIHGPIIPREVFACGKCLVLSGEIASKQRYRSKLVSGDNLLIVEDPKDHAALAAALRGVITNPEGADVIGQRGEELSRSLEDHDAFVSGCESLLARHVRAPRPRPPSRSQPQPQRGQSAPTMPVALEALEAVIPNLLAFLRRSCEPVVAAFVPSAERDPLELAADFCDFVVQRIDREAFGPDLSKLLAVIEYSKARLIAARAPRDATPVFPVSDRLVGARVSKESVWELRPVRGNALSIVEFEYDVSTLDLLPGPAAQTETPTDESALEALEPNPMLVLFHRSANLIPCELRIDEATRQLLELCDGARTTAGIVETMGEYFGMPQSAIDEEVATKVCVALEYLYRNGVIVFGAHSEGWGWAGGLRSNSDGEQATRAGRGPTHRH